MPIDHEREQWEREQRRIDEDNRKGRASTDDDDDLPERPTGELRPGRRERDEE